MPRFTISTREWDERSYVQGLLIHKPTGTTLVIEADPGAGGETFEVHARTAAGKYLGKARVGYGHGSTVGIEATSDSTCNLWWGDDRAKATGWAPYRIGQTGTLSFVKAAALPKGDVSIDQAADLICVRTGNRYRGYTLSAAKAGKTAKLFDFTIPGWGNRFQGHLVYGGRLFVHRDLATKSTSKAHVFDYQGHQLAVLDTTRMGDEAEGFVEKDGTVYAVKRTGGTGPSRVIVATPLDVKVEPPKPPPPKPPTPKRLTGVDVSSHHPGWKPATGDAFVFVKASEGTGYTNPERAAQLAAARAKGLVTGHYHWLTPGKPLEQAAYFVANADIRAGDPLWCDWEQQSDGSHPTIQDVAAFIAEVQRLVPTSRVGLYCNRSDWMSTSVKAGDGLWIAQYGVAKPDTATDWIFWQYTDKPIDQNVSKFTSRADLVKWLTVNRKPTPPKIGADAQPPPVIPPAPQNVGVWAVDPGKVSTVLLGRQGTTIGNELSPGTTIADGVEFVLNNVGRYALLRSDGWSYDREYLVQIGVGPVPVKRQFPVIPDYDTTERIKLRGGLVCRCVAVSLPWVEFAMLEAGVIKWNLDFYQFGYRTDVKASAASHAAGQMIDSGQYSDAALKVWRELGWMMQHRTVAQGFTGDHGHGGPVGCPHGSTTGPSNAASQQRAWLNGRDGLRQNLSITGPEPKGKATPKWDAALSAYLKKIGAPPMKTT